MEVVDLNLAYRWYIGYDLDQAWKAQPGTPLGTIWPARC